MPKNLTKLTHETYEAILNAPKGKTNVQLAREFGVSDVTVSKIRRGIYKIKENDG